MNKKSLIAVIGIFLLHGLLFIVTKIDYGINLLWFTVNIIFYIAGIKIKNRKESFFYLMGYFILLTIFGAVLKAGSSSQE